MVIARTTLLEGDWKTHQGTRKATQGFDSDFQMQKRRAGPCDLESLR